jgi:hypothetical protein
MGVARLGFIAIAVKAVRIQVTNFGLSWTFLWVESDRRETAACPCSGPESWMGVFTVVEHLTGHFRATSGHLACLRLANLCRNPFAGFLFDKPNVFWVLVILGLWSLCRRQHIFFFDIFEASSHV